LSADRSAADSFADRASRAGEWWMRRGAFLLVRSVQHGFDKSRPSRPSLRRTGSHPGEVLRLRLEPLILFGQDDPGLRAAGPEMRSRTQPRSVVQRAGADAKRVSRSRLGLRATPDPCGAIRADPPSDRAPAVCFALERARLGPAKWKAVPASGLGEPHCPTSRIRALGAPAALCSAAQQAEDSADHGGVPVRSRGVPRP
jgi:hypothetical protein